MAIQINGSTGVSGVNGTGTNPVYSGGDSDTGIFFPALGQVAITTNGVQRLLITETGDIQSASVLSFPGGSASAPSIAFTGDTDTGLYSPSANSVAISTGGSGRLFVDASGNVGINTAAGGASGFGTFFKIKTTSSSPGFFLENGAADSWWGVYGGTSAADSAAIVYPSTGSIRIATSTSVGVGGFSEKIRITSAGLVGIGTSSPSRNLDIAAGQANVGITSNTTSAGNEPTLVFTHAGNNSYVIKGGNNLQFASDAGTNVRMTLTTAGSLGIGSTNPNHLLSVTASAGAQDIFLAGQTGVSNGYQITSNGTALTHAWFNSGSEAARINSSGRLGIGTSSPSGKTEIVSSGSESTLILRNSNTASSTYSELKFAPFTGTTAAAAAIRAEYYQDNNSSLAFRTTNTNAEPTTKMFIDQVGRVGIGTSSPSYSLDVSGIIQAGNGFLISQNGGSAVRVGAAGQPDFNNPGSDLYFSVTAGQKFAWGNSANRTDMTLDSSGRLGIGATGPSALLHVNSSYSGYGGAAITDGSPLLAITGGQNKTIRIDGGAYQGGTSTANLHLSNSANSNFNTANGYLLQVSSFDNGSTNSNNFIISSSSYSGSAYTYTERLRIDSNGRLLVGTSSARANFFNSTLSSAIQVEGNDTNRRISVVGGAEGYPYVILGRQKGSTGQNVSVSSADGLGAITFQGNDGSEFVEAATIEAYVDGTPGANDMPGRLVFSVTRNDSASPTEALRINNQGGISGFAAGGWDNYVASNSSAAGTSVSFYNGRHSATGTFTGTNSYYVWTNGNVQNTNGSYTAISDAKLKENIVDAGSQWNDLKAIRIRNWNFKAETGHETHRQIGPIAQELETVCPGLVFATPDRNEDGNETGDVTKGVNQSVLYMKAVKALQEAMERIETLEAENAHQKASLTDILSRISALEGA